MKKVILAMTIAALVGCTTMEPVEYSIPVDNRQALKKFRFTNFSISHFTQSARFNPSCRFLGPLELPDDLSFAQYIVETINDDLKAAGVYSSRRRRISGDITTLAFSSSSGFTNGFWDISIMLVSPRGTSLNVSNRFIFKSGLRAVEACNATADALYPAIQNLLSVAIADPKFRKLL